MYIMVVRQVDALVLLPAYVSPLYRGALYNKSPQLTILVNIIEKAHIQAKYPI